MADAREISQRAHELAVAHPPAVVLENLFLGFFSLIGMILGRSWYYGSKVLYFIALAFLDGYSRGAKVAPKPAADALPRGPAGVSQPMVDDPRTIDAYQTPFGIPFGPNVQASHE